MSSFNNECLVLINCNAVVEVEGVYSHSKLSTNCIDMKRTIILKLKRRLYYNICHARYSILSHHVNLTYRP